MSGRRLGLLSLVLAALLTSGGCGGDDGGAESWASDVCTNLSEWIDDVDEATASLTQEGLGFDEADLRGAVDRARDATDELVSDLRELEPPETEGGEQAREELDEFSAGLRDQLETVERALDENEEPLEVAATVAAALATTGSRLDQTLEDLEDVDPAGELEDAFRNSEDCESLRERIEEIRSEEG